MHRLLYLPAALCQAFAPPRAPQHYWHECSVQPVAPTAWRGRRRLGGRVQARTDAQLKRGIGEFYDESSGIWEEVWGEHMHHGYYREGEKPASFARHVEAQDDMIEKALELCGADGVAARCRRDGRRLRVLDVGCGVGGSSRYIARKYGADVVGLTLSPKQAARGNELSQGLNVTLKAEDATSTAFADGSFDLVWSLESGEHMPDKPRFVEELARLCAPGGAVSCVARGVFAVDARRRQRHVRCPRRSPGATATSSPISGWAASSERS